MKPTELRELSDEELMDKDQELKDQQTSLWSLNL